MLITGPAALSGFDSASLCAQARAMANGHAQNVDVAIVGGGMVGLTLALALVEGGLSTLVVDALDPARVVDARFDGRVSAIAHASCRLLESLSLWPLLSAEAQPINDILVSDGRLREGAAPFFLHFDHREIGAAPLGQMIENRHFRQALQALATQRPALTLRAPMQCTEAQRDDAGATVHLADGTIVRARLVVAADGRASPLREESGIRTLAWRYPQVGIVATVAHERPHGGMAQEYFLPSGPFAILPMTGNRSSLVWTEREAYASAFLGLDDAAFTHEVGRRFGPYLGPLSVSGPRWSYPLSLHLATDYVRTRFALVGDAAHGIHPIAGQGLNMGLRDVAALAEVLVDAARLGLDIGSLSVLERYERWRRFDNVLLAATTDILNRLFSNDVGVLRLARDVGLGLVGRIAPARRLFMRHAGGSVGDLPRLLRGERL